MSSDCTISEPQENNTRDVNILMEVDTQSESDSELNDLKIPGSSVAVAEIEDMVVSFLSQLAFSGRHSDARSNNVSTSEFESEDIESSLKNHQTRNKVELQLIDRTKEGNAGSRSTAFKSIKFPKRCAKGSIRPMAQLFRVLDLTHESIVYNVPATKRDIYYKDVSLFKNQRVVDSLIDDLAATFELERSDLNIRATSKGLICGSGLSINLLTGESVQINDTEGTLIPVGEDIKSFSVDPNVSWVLIVEKEAVFQTLSRLKLASHPSMPGRGLIITGKGYPDIATRHLVKTLSDALPSSIPILAMVDGDPYGIDILSVYKYGSRSLQHESQKLAARRIKWLGLWASELEAFGVDRDRLLPITKHDEKKALSMLRRPVSTMPVAWRKELMHMIHGRRKAEIEILSTVKSDPQVLDTRHLLSDKQLEQATTDVDSYLVHHGPDSTPDSTPSTGTSSFTPPSLTPLSASGPYSSPLTSPTSGHPPTPPAFHSPPLCAPLVRYLSCKIKGYVASARARAGPVDTNT